MSFAYNPENFFFEKSNELIYIGYKFNEYQTAPILQEALLKYNKKYRDTERFAGNIRDTMFLTDSLDYTDELLMPIVCNFIENSTFMDSVKILDVDANISLDNMWANFQRKGEFNPNHRHRGLFSFVLWLDIPYSIEDEFKHPAVKNSNAKRAGCFEFSFVNHMGRLTNLVIEADNRFNNSVIVFPSQLTHCVYPFFTSNKPRISVSGNFCFNVGTCKQNTSSIDTP